MLASHWNRRPWLAWAALAVVACVTPAVGGAPYSEWEPGTSISGQTSPCGYGPWYTGQEVTFSHRVTFTIELSPGNGYVINCNTGTDAYLEFRWALEGSSYTYAVWGQLGDYQ